MANTTRQTILNVARAVVIGNAIKGQAGPGSSFTLTGGTFTANGTTQVVIADAAVTANSSIIITLKTVGGTVSPSVPYIDTITAGTGFTTKGTASDTSVYNYLILD